MHTSILNLLIAIVAAAVVVAGRVAVEEVVHEGAGEDLRELVLLEQRQDARGCNFISSLGGVLGLEPRLLRLPETLERGGEYAVEAVEVPPRPCAGAVGVGAADARLLLPPFLHRRAEGGAPGLRVVAALAGWVAAEPPSATPPGSHARHLLSPRVPNLAGSHLICRRGESNVAEADGGKRDGNPKSSRSLHIYRNRGHFTGIP